MFHPRLLIPVHLSELHKWFSWSHHTVFIRRSWRELLNKSYENISDQGFFSYITAWVFTLVGGTLCLSTCESYFLIEWAFLSRLKLVHEISRQILKPCNMHVSKSLNLWNFSNAKISGIFSPRHRYLTFCVNHYNPVSWYLHHARAAKCCST